MMQELGIDAETIAQWFCDEQQVPYVLIRVTDEHAAAWHDELSAPIRRCYISDALLEKSVQENGCLWSEIVASKLPDRGSTMAGDFGEILVYLYHQAVEPGVELIGPKKWRLKQDRTKPAPFSDVVHFVLPYWPESSSEDRILCSEVKTKATAGNSSPIEAAITDSEKDRTSRLSKTLVWLRERALTEDLGTTKIAHLDRFIKATDHPEADRQFRAVAVICESIENNELVRAPEEESTDSTVVVIAVPKLKQRYEEIFDYVLEAVAEHGGER